FGLQEIESPHAPRVFENGQPQPLLQAVKKHVDIELLAEASRPTRSRKVDGKASKPKPRSTPNKMGSSGFQPFQPTSSRTGVCQTGNTGNAGAGCPRMTDFQMGLTASWQQDDVLSLSISKCKLLATCGYTYMGYTHCRVSPVCQGAWQELWISLFFNNAFIDCSQKDRCISFSSSFQGPGLHVNPKP
ncbi:ML3, partial [Symbiodinium sp. KB8]